MVDLMQMFLVWHVAQCPPPPERYTGSAFRENSDCVLISTIDNPAWNIGIKLTNTNLAGARMAPVKLDNGDDWIICHIIEDEFTGIGDQYKLINILEYFHKLLQQAGLTPPVDTNATTDATSHLAERLQEWYAAQCLDISDVPTGVQPWHDRYGLSIFCDSSRCWRVTFDISGTNIENAYMEPIDLRNGEDDWMTCEITTDAYGTTQFVGDGDPGKLLSILARFFELVENAKKA